MSVTDSSAPVKQEDIITGEENQRLFSPSDDLVPSCCEYGSYSCLEFKRIEGHIHLQLQFFLSKADLICNCLIHRQKILKRDCVIAVLQKFLCSCQPFFSHVEEITRSTVAQKFPLPAEICTRLLEYSQQLCDKLEQMLLNCASRSLFSLDEKDPHSLSYFCIGESQLGRLKVTAFRYCKPTPYLAKNGLGLYKRMRWNVDRLPLYEEREEETVGETDYYFLCYEDNPNEHTEADVNIQDHNRLWSIGRWLQVYSDPKSDEINDWILCKVPLADYDRLLILGGKEPSSCDATDYLMKLLMNLQVTD